MQNELTTYEEASAMIGVSMRTLYKWINQGKLTRVKDDKDRRRAYLLKSQVDRICSIREQLRDHRDLIRDAAEVGIIQVHTSV